MGIHIVIERSDDSKIVFKCKAPSSPTQIGSGSIGKKPVRKAANCPFRIRANYSIRAKRWTLVVVNSTHNHNHHGCNINTTPNDKSIDYPITPESPKNENTLPPLIPHYTDLIYQQPISTTSNINTQLPHLAPLQQRHAKSLHGDVISLLTTMNTTLSINDQIKERVYEQMILTMKTVVPHHKLNNYYI